MSVSLFIWTTFLFIPGMQKIMNNICVKFYGAWKSISFMQDSQSAAFLQVQQNILDTSLMATAYAQIHVLFKLLRNFLGQKRSKNYNHFWDLQITTENTSQAFSILHYRWRTLRGTIRKAIYGQLNERSQCKQHLINSRKHWPQHHVLCCQILMENLRSLQMPRKMRKQLAPCLCKRVIPLPSSQQSLTRIKSITQCMTKKCVH